MHIQTSFWALAAGVNLCLAGFPQRASPNALRARAEKFRPAAPEVQAVAREAATTQPLHRRDSPYLNNQTQSKLCLILSCVVAITSRRKEDVAKKALAIIFPSFYSELS